MSEEVLRLRRVGGRMLASAEHRVAGDAVVVFCHGFRGERTGPARVFVRAARRLAEHGIGSIRFDQYGSGDSEGDFLDSRFDDWVDAIESIGRAALDDGRRLALWGQSMGASAAICAAARLSPSAVVAWVPDASTDEYRPDGSGFMEEGGQRVADAYWIQAHAADVPARLRETAAPCHLVFGTADEYVSAADREALVAATGPDDLVDVMDGWPHSAWTAEQADRVVERSLRFLLAHLKGGGEDRTVA